MTLPVGLAGLLAMAATIQHDGQTAEMHKQHSMMASEPHHILAMAYHTNMANFAKALETQSAKSSSLNLDFSRSAVNEIRRSFDQMKQHHNEHMQVMSSKMNSPRDNMMQKMETHQTELGTQLTSLENEIQGAAPNAKKVAALAASIHEHLDAMYKMHQSPPASKMKM
ncbi:MAG: hypothetical protein NTW74_13580 [Acidobacteria bacterium]|nr:hypothetical protein [Acidobacteriota bacterium]